MHFLTLSPPEPSVFVGRNIRPNIPPPTPTCPPAAQMHGASGLLGLLFGLAASAAALPEQVHLAVTGVEGEAVVSWANDGETRCEVALSTSAAGPWAVHVGFAPVRYELLLV